MGGEKRWLFPQQLEIPGPIVQEYTDPDGHGSCVLSKAAGARYGVAKRANTVVVKLPLDALGEESTSVLTLTNAFNMVTLDVILHKTFKNVVIVSWGRYQTKLALLMLRLD